jgi:hypothetical protein
VDNFADVFWYVGDILLYAGYNNTDILFGTAYTITDIKDGYLTLTAIEKDPEMVVRGIFS